MIFQRIIQGDCLKVLPTLPDESVDLVLTDPPFYLPVRNYASRDKKWRPKIADTSIMRNFFESVFKEYRRILKWSGHLLCFCDPISYPIFFYSAYNHFHIVRCLVWYKGKNYFPLGKGAWRHSFELILHARDRGASFKKENRQDVIESKVVPNKDRLHPAEKPVKLLEKLIDAVVPVNGIVLDSFLGSGAVMEASRNTNKSCIGIDNDSGYCEIARSRVFPKELPLINDTKYEFQIFKEGVSLNELAK